MQVSVLLQSKGSEVVTVAPERPVAEVLAVLARHGIGAVVVTGDDRHIDGVLSERDVVRALAREGAAALDRAAAQLMTAAVVTCEPDTTVEQLMAMMTERRIRHLPVVDRGALAGIVSIGDVVKHKISTLQFERDQLDSYVHQS